MHGRGDRAVSADQLKGLVPGARLVEQGRDDRSDVGAGDRATGDRRGCEPDLASGESVGEAARAQDGPVQVPDAQMGLGGGLGRDVGSPDLVTAGLWWLAGSHRGDLHESADPGPRGGGGHQHRGSPVDGVLARGAAARPGAGRGTAGAVSAT